MRRLFVAFIAVMLIWLFPVAASAQSAVIQPTFVRNWLNINPPTSLLGHLGVQKIFTDDSGNLWVTAESSASQTASSQPLYTDLYKFDGTAWQLMHSFNSQINGFAEYDGIYFASSGGSIYSSLDGSSWNDAIDIANSAITKIDITSFTFSSDNYLYLSAVWAYSGAVEGTQFSLNMNTGNLLTLIKSGSHPLTQLSLHSPNPGLAVGASMVADNSGDVYVFNLLANNGAELDVLNSKGMVSHSLKSPQISLAVNPEGDVWFATQDGNIYAAAGNGSLQGTVPSLRSPVTSFAFGPHGSWWIGTKGGDIYEMVQDQTSSKYSKWIYRFALAGKGQLSLTIAKNGNIYAKAGNSLYYFLGNRNAVILTIGSNQILRSSLFGNLQQETADVPPQIINGRTMVPVRFVAQDLGYQVGWEPSSRTVTLSNGTNTLDLPIGSMQATLQTPTGSSTMNLDTPAQIVEGRTMVPIRFVAQAFSAGVFWNGESSEVFVIQ
jgi:hypothetical protein